MRLAGIIRLKHFLLVLIGLIAGFLIAEIGLRIYLAKTAPIEPVACKHEDPIVHHGYNPNTICRYKTKEWNTEIRINSIGLRNKEIGEKNKFRVLVLGDSFTAAESVNLEKTAVYLAEQNLNNEGKNAEVINAGIPSYSPILEYLWLREFGLELMPDLVILNFDLGDVSGDNFLNDYYLGKEETLDENFSFRKQSWSDNLWKDTRWQLTTTRGKKPLTLASKIKFWLHTNVKVYNFIAESTKKIARKIKGVPEEPIYVLGDVKNDFEYVTRSEDNANNLEVYKISIENLKRINRLLTNNHIQFIVVFFPHGHQVSGNEWAEGRQFYGLEKGKLYSRKSIYTLMEMSEEVGIEAYDTSNYFINADPLLFPLFYPFDGHFTENGNMVMAKALTDIIRNKLSINE